jgi:hypothetical protein
MRPMAEIAREILATIDRFGDGYDATKRDELAALARSVLPLGDPLRGARNVSPRLWCCNDAPEAISAEDVDEAVEEEIERLLEYLPDAEERVALDELPETLTCNGYAPMEPTLPAWGPLDRLLEDIDQELGDPSRQRDPKTPRMIEAEAAFLATVLEEYQPWAHEVVATREIDVEAWLRANHPDWIKE